MKQSLAATLLIGTLALAAPSTAADIDLAITGFSDDGGMARIVLMRDEAGYLGETPVARVVSVPITSGRVIWRADDVEPGRYALIAHHDQDGDGDLNRPFLGLPQEPYGYSGGAWTSMGLPGWDEVAFEVGDVPARQMIQLRTNAFAAASQVAVIALPALGALFGGLAVARRLRRRAAV